MKSVLGACLAVIICLSPLYLAGEDFQLTDGTKISGTLIAVNGDTLRVKTAYGEIEIPKSNVVSITFSAAPKVPSTGTDSSEVPQAVDETLQGSTYTNRTANFQVTVPGNWKIAPELRAGNPSLIATLSSQDGSLFLAVVAEKFSGSLPTYKVLSEASMQTKLKDYEKVSEAPIQLDGKTGIRMICHGKSASAGNMEMTFAVYIVPYESRMVRLTFWTLNDLFKDALPVFEKIALSYQSISPVKQAVDGPHRDVPSLNATMSEGQ